MRPARARDSIRAMSSPVNDAPPPLTGVTGERTLGQLVSDVSTDLSQIMRGELELAKAEIKQDVTHAGKGAGMFAGAALFGLYGLGLLFLGLAGVIAIWLEWWAGLLIMAALLFLVAGILALVGKKQVTKVKGKPEKAIDQGKQTVEKLKASAQAPHKAGMLAPGTDHLSGSGATPAAKALDNALDVERREATRS